MKIFCLCICVSFSCFAADPSFGGTSKERHEKMKKELSPEKPRISPLQGPYLTGDWGGLRSKLASRGLTIGMGYAMNLVENIRGGKKRGFGYAGSFSVDANVDIGKQTSLKGLSFYTSMKVWKVGHNLSARKIGNQYPVQQLYGRGFIQFNECYLRGELFNKALILKLGRLNGGNDFLQSHLYYQFMNKGFDGNPIAVFLNGPFTSYPNATWGCLVNFRPYFKQISGKIGAYVADQRCGEDKRHRQNWSFRGSDGIQFITEWSYQVGETKNGMHYPGRYRLGCFYYTKSPEHKHSGQGHHRNCGYYILVDQMVYQPEGSGSSRGLTSFIALLFAPKDRNLFPFFLTTGLVYKGLFSFGPKDYTNLGLVYGRYSRDRPQMQNRTQDFESIVECNHWFQVNQWLTVGPDFQYIIHPKGFKTIKNAWVLGIQMKMLL